MITEVRKYKTTDGDPDLQTRFRSNPRVLRRELRMSSTELAATSTTRENTGELTPHLASQLILRVFQNLVKLGQLQQSLLGCHPDLVYRLEWYSRCRSLFTRGKAGIFNWRTLKAFKNE